MSKIAIATDTNSSMTVSEAKELGVYMLPMPFIVDQKEYLEGYDCTLEEFFQKLNSGSDVMTSQPSVGKVYEFWEDILKENDEVIYIPMSSALSSSCETAMGLARSFDGRVHVVDNRRISITQYGSVVDALNMVKAGYSAQEIVDYLNKTALDCGIYLMVNRLDLLKKSGRVTPAAATIATVLNLKPILQIQGGKLDSYAKVKGIKAAESKIMSAIDDELAGRFAGKKVILRPAYSGSEELGQEWLAKVQAHYPNYDVQLSPLPISICCHVADGVRAIGVMEVFEKSKN